MIHMNDFQLYKVWYDQCKSNHSVTPSRKLASPTQKHGGTCHQRCFAEDGTPTFLPTGEDAATRSLAQGLKASGDGGGSAPASAAEVPGFSGPAGGLGE